MPFKIEITSTYDRNRATVYLVAVTINGALQPARQFHSKGDAERFARREASRLLENGKHAARA